MSTSYLSWHRDQMMEQDLLPLVRVKYFAWLHIGTMPIIRTHLWVRSAASLLIAEAVIIPVVVQRLTVLPLASFSTKLASRSSFSKREMRLIASFQEIRSQLVQNLVHDIQDIVRDFHY